MAFALDGPPGTAAAQEAGPQGGAGQAPRAERQQATGKGVAAAAGRRRHRAFNRHGQRQAAYTATAGHCRSSIVRRQSAAVFYTAYVAKGAGAERPLTFVFNGGPGAASAFCISAWSGRVCSISGPDARDAAPATLHDNPDTWLRFTDLVLVDPIGPAGAVPSSQMTPSISGACAPTPTPWRNSSRSTSTRTTASPHRNIRSAKARAASAPPRRRARCGASRALPFPAS